MPLLFSSNPVGFFDPEIHGTNLPADLVEITPEEHAALLAGQAQGKLIAADEAGRPILVDPRPLSDQERLQRDRAAMVCSRFQMRAALHVAGLLEAAEAAVDAAGPLVKIAWADADSFRRDSKTIREIADHLSLTDEQIDDLFRTGASLQP